MGDIDYRASRGLDASLTRSLSESRFFTSSSTVIITDPTGTGKAYLCCPLAHRAMRRGSPPSASALRASSSSCTYPVPTAPGPGCYMSRPGQRCW